MAKSLARQNRISPDGRPQNDGSLPPIPAQIYRFQIEQQPGPGAYESVKASDSFDGSAVTLYIWTPEADEYPGHAATLAALVDDFPGVDLFSASRRLYLAVPQGTDAVGVLAALKERGLFGGFSPAAGEESLPVTQTTVPAPATPTVSWKLLKSGIAVAIGLSLGLWTVYHFLTTKTIDPSAPAPKIDFSSTRGEIARGESTKLFWTAWPADHVHLDPGQEVVPFSGEKQVTPTATTDYTITATGRGGSASAHLTVKVHEAFAISFSADPPQIGSGEEATLAWQVTMGSHVSINPGIGEVNNTGTMLVRPYKSTPYTLTAQDPDGYEHSREIKVEVVSPAAGRAKTK